MSTTNKHGFVAKPSVTVRQPAKGKRRWLWLGLGLCGVAALSASAGALLAVAIAGTPLMQSQLTSEEAKVFSQGDIASGKKFQLPQLTRPVNILVLGTKVLSTDVANPPAETRDLGYHATINSLEGLSDSMLLLRFNPTSQQLVVLSLPRDTRTYVDGIGVTKLNEANATGGPALAARSTSDLLGGVGIDRYVRINVLGVEKLIDALGGVKINVPQDMKYQDDSQHLYINLKKGEQRLNGAQAVQFLRFRYDSYGDIGRVQRQQMFLRALREQALKPATVARLPQILSVIQSNLDTNLKVEELIALAGFASDIDRSNMQMLMLPGTFSGNEFEASYWLPNQDQISTLVQRYFGLMAPSFSADDGSDHVTIAIQDGTNHTAVVEKVISKLGEAGYSDIYVDQPWNEPIAVTSIIAQQGDRDKAEAIQKSLGFGEVLVESTGNLESDITIRLGEDALVPPSPDAAKPAAEPTAEPDAALPDAGASVPEAAVESAASTEAREPVPATEPVASPEVVQPVEAGEPSAASPNPEISPAVPSTLTASPAAQAASPAATVPNETDQLSQPE